MTAFKQKQIIWQVKKNRNISDVSFEETQHVRERMTKRHKHRFQFFSHNPTHFCSNQLTNTRNVKSNSTLVFATDSCNLQVKKTNYEIKTLTCNKLLQTYTEYSRHPLTCQSVSQQEVFFKELHTKWLKPTRFRIELEFLYRNVSTDRNVSRRGSKTHRDNFYNLLSRQLIRTLVWVR